MKRYFRVLALAAVASVLLGCPTDMTVGTIDDPLVLDTYGITGTDITWNGYVGGEQLYIKIVGALPNNNHTATVSVLTGDVDLYTYTDAFVTAQESSKNAGTADETCSCQSNDTGEMYLMIDGTVSEGWKTFTLYVGT
jgi:hypothetical protein